MFLQQTYAIWWKNITLRRRHWIMTSFEVVFPIVCYIIVVLMRSKVDIFTKIYANETYHDSVDDELIYSRLNIHGMKLLYAPKTDFTADLIRTVQLKLGIYNEGIKGFSGEEELISYYDAHGDENTNAVILFEDAGDYAPKKLIYDIKMYEQHVLWKTDTLFQDFVPYIDKSGSENYLHEGFLSIQLSLDTSFIELVSKKDFDVSMAFQEFPFPPHLQDNGINNAFLDLLPIFTSFSFIVLCVNTLQQVMSEKSSGVNALMKMHGLSPFTLWKGWLINGMVFAIIPVTGVVLLLTFSWGANYATIEYCHYLILFFFLLFYCAASISSLLALTTIFDKLILCMAVGVMSWVVPGIIFVAVKRYIDVTFSFWFLLIPNISLFYGYTVITNFEQREIQLNFSNLFETPTESSDDATMGLILVMLAVDTIFYFFITLYLDQLYPGPSGMSKSWHFPFFALRRLWKGTKSNQYPKMNNREQIIITVNKLLMTYGDKTAVDIGSLEVHKGKITTLLGPNGAGKTTIMSILSGLLNPTSGTVIIDDLELNDENLEEIRKSVRICPQEIILFADLTISEQLTFFGMLRNLSNNDAHEHAKSILREKLKLNDKFDCLTKKISGGMKKAISLGIALIGNPKVLILDEPTAGIDIEGRAATRELIRSFKQSNTILISTHLMEEADELSDDIKILDNGKILREGEPSHLKTNDIGHPLSVKEITWDQLTQVETQLDGLLGEDQTTEYFAKYDLIERSNLLEKVLECLKKQGISVTSCNRPPSPVDQRVSESEENAQENKRLLSTNSTGCLIFRGNSFEHMENVQNSLDTFTDKKNPNVYSAKYRLKSQPKAEFIKLFEFFEKKNIKFDFANPTLEDLYTKIVENNVDALEKNTKISLNDEPQQHQKNSGCSLGRAALIIAKKRQLYFYKKWINYITMTLLMTFLTWLVINLCGDGIMPVNIGGSKLQLVLNTYGHTGAYYGLHGAYDSLLANTYSGVIASQHGVPRNVENIQQAIVQEGKENIAYYQQRMIIGTEFYSIGDEIKNVTVMYSHNALHSVSISLNVAMNTLVKYMLGEEYSIAASNTPLHSAQNKAERVEQSSTSNLIIWLTLFPLGPLFILSNAILLVRTETSTSIKHLQYIAGVRPYMYWIVNYLCDIIFCIVPIILCALFFYSTEIYDTGPLITILTLYVVTMIPFAYIPIGSLERAHANFILSNVSIGILLAFITLAMEIPSGDSFRSASKIVPYFFAINPQFTLNYMLAKYSNKMVANHNWNIKTSNEKKSMCSYNSSNPCCEGETSCADFQSFFNDTSCTSIWIVSIASAVVCMVFWWYHDCIGGISNKNGDTKTDHSSAVLKVDNVTKQYGSKSVIGNLSFDVNKGQCFAILGPNGAGKSTAFRLLAKQERYTDGNITTNTLQTDKHQKRGYCPQQHALIKVFTAREMLNIFAELRGMHRDTVTDLLEKFDLLKDADKLCAHLSGGNKRKLNVCISMIANPQIIILDEPTTGVDPISRKKMWNSMEELKAGNTSIILSSHSMAECEAFCDELLILKDGWKADIGTLEQLKQKYSDGFVIKLIIPNIDQYCRESVEKSINDDFEQPTIINCDTNCMHFHAKNTSWFAVLQKLEKLKEKHNLDYDVNKSTLHDVFLKVINRNTSEENVLQTSIL